MTNAEGSPQNWTWPQKLAWAAVPLLVSMLILVYGPLFQGIAGTVLFVLMGAALGLLTFFITGGWTLKCEITGEAVRIKDSRRQVTVPLDRIGMVVRNGGFPFPTLWLVLRNSELGQEIPAKGVDPHAAKLIEAYQRRNPGKKVTVLPVAGGHLRSVSAFTAELKRRIPPLGVDERLAGN